MDNENLLKRLHKAERRIVDLYRTLEKAVETINELQQSGGGSGVPDAPSDGKQYVRLNNSWVEATFQSIFNISGGVITDGTYTISITPETVTLIDDVQSTTRLRAASGEFYNEASIGETTQIGINGISFGNGVSLVNISNVTGTENYNIDLPNKSEDQVMAFISDIV